MESLLVTRKETSAVNRCTKQNSCILTNGKTWYDRCRLGILLFCFAKDLGSSKRRTLSSTLSLGFEGSSIFMNESAKVPRSESQSITGKIGQPADTMRKL